MSSSVERAEVEKFAKDSASWRDENGPFAPLHRLNPSRLSYIKARICARYGRDEKGLKSLESLKILDIGCGGGLVSEPLARLGAAITGIDADAQAIDVAKDYAARAGLKIDYRRAAAENLKEQFDVVLALEIVEHVANVDEFIQSCAKLVKPGGLLIVSTLNRTPKSYALGVIAAEYILRWVPRGTHDWKKFVRPSELARAMRAASLEPSDLIGLVFDPVKGDFKLSGDASVNYFLCGAKQGKVSR